MPGLRYVPIPESLLEASLAEERRGDPRDLQLHLELDVEVAAALALKSTLRLALRHPDIAYETAEFARATIAQIDRALRVAGWAATAAVADLLYDALYGVGAGRQ